MAQVNLPLAFSMMLHGIRLEGKEKDVCIIPSAPNTFSGGI